MRSVVDGVPKAHRIWRWRYRRAVLRRVRRGTGSRNDKSRKASCQKQGDRRAGAVMLFREAMHVRSVVRLLGTSGRPQLLNARLGEKARHIAPTNLWRHKSAQLGTLGALRVTVLLPSLSQRIVLVISSSHALCDSFPQLHSHTAFVDTRDSGPPSGRPVAWLPQ